MRRRTTVTSPGWYVSAMTGSQIAGAVLSTFRVRTINGHETHVHGEGTGRTFPSSDAAFAWALEHGYLQLLVIPWCRHCRTVHTFLGRKSGFCDTRGVFVR